MIYNSQGQVKKSLYIFLTAILGVLLFLILHRLIVFVYLTLVAVDYPAFGVNFSYPQFLAFDYLTLIISLMLGAWYGVWRGFTGIKKFMKKARIAALSAISQTKFGLGA